MSANPGLDPRRRRLLWGLAALVLLLMLVLAWMLRADNLVPAMLKYTGNALGLEITAGGVSEYRLRGTPQLVVRQLVARQPGASTPVLRVERLLVSLPWSTLRARGKQLTANRIELDAPVLDVAAYQQWKATRPAADTQLPTLVRGARITDGVIVGTKWRVEGVALELAQLSADKPVTAHLRARYAGDGLSVPMDLYLAMTRPAAGAGIGAVGQVVVQAAQWQLPSQVRLSAILKKGAGLQLEPALLGAHARHVSGTTSRPFALGLAGPLRMDGSGFAVQPMHLAVRGPGALPPLAAAGEFLLDDALQLLLEGNLAEWPAAWPALPAPIGQSDSPLPFLLAYRGATDFSDIATLQLRRDATRFDGRFRLSSVSDWANADAGGSPLPPITGSLTSPKLEISGALLEGVEIELRDDAVPAQAHTP
ncbi:MAG: hypothetical protein LH491_04335 [Pseudoxanthomonas sp.]|nr:hypothetical protein [Pseudoxanthomonas sp.]